MAREYPYVGKPACQVWAHERAMGSRKNFDTVTRGSFILGTEVLR